MADIDFDEYGGIPRFSGQQVRRFVNVAGALCSLGLVIGVGVWGYNLAVRDVSGIPVIKAAKGPMRVAPDNPGGEIADHQGMAVNVVPELRSSEGLPSEIILAPAPVELSVEDSPGLTVADQGYVEAKGDTAAELPSAVPLEAMISEEQASPSVSTEDAVALALAEALGQDVAPLAELAPEVDAVDVSGSGPGVMRSVRPQRRPGAQGLSAIAEVSSTAAPVSSEVDPSTLAVGTRLVQLGAFDNADQARGEWNKLTSRFGDLMSGKSVVIQAAESGGRTFYRLRAHGFDGEDDARRFCAALLAEDAACIPVAHR
ncbi:SPOR domain-containing protein [Thioclava sp. FR2]|uniref:SPOR domain-containing protein n=1 Tax=Thioclava sp. FR2 TaxID=3445780 RepID=UPI003EBEE678